MVDIGVSACIGHAVPDMPTEWAHAISFMEASVTKPDAQIPRREGSNCVCRFRVFALERQEHTLARHHAQFA